MPTISIIYSALQVAGLLEEDEYVARTRAGLAAQRVALEGALAALRAAAPAAGTAEH